MLMLMLLLLKQLLVLVLLLLVLLLAAAAVVACIHHVVDIVIGRVDAVDAPRRSEDVRLGAGVHVVGGGGCRWESIADHRSRRVVGRDDAHSGIGSAHRLPAALVQIGRASGR